MSKDEPPTSPGHGLFDPSSLLGMPPTSVAGGLPFPSLAYLPSAYNLLGRQPMFPPALFGGLGAFTNPLLNPAFNPAAGGADWWLAASEHARRLAGTSGLEFFAGSLGNNNLSSTINPLGLTLDSNQSGLELLLRTQTEAEKSAYLAEVSKQFAGSLSPPSASSLKSPTKSTSSPTSQRRSSSSSTSKRVTGSPSSTASSSASGHYINGRSPTPTSSSHASSTVTSRSATVTSRSMPSSAEGSRKRKQKAPKPTAVPLTSPTNKSSPLSIPSYSRIKASLNSQISSIPSQNKERKVDNGILSDSDSQSLVSSGSSTISDDSFLASDEDKLRQRRKKLKLSEENPYQITPHQIDGFKKQLLADTIRQRVQNKSTSEISPQSSPKKERKIKNPKFLSQIDNEDQLAHQRELKLKLEAELKQQKERLRLLMKESENGVIDHNTFSLSSSAGISKSVPPLKLKIPNPKLKFRHEENGGEEKLGSRDLDNLVHTTSGSDDDSDSDDSGSSDEDSSMYSDANQSNDNSHKQTTEPGEKHSLDSESMDEGGSKKKRKTVTDETELRIPLEHGWSRRTTIHTMGRRGIVGEVLYFAPCGKKMKTIPDVMRYLDRHSITDLTRDNFTFNTKINVGEFYELLEGQSSPVKLSELEVMERIEMSRGKRARARANARLKKQRGLKQQALAKQLMEMNMKRKLEQEELSQKAAEIRFQKRLEKQQQKDVLRRQQQLKYIERQKQQEQLKMARQQEKYRKQEQLRAEREHKAQQILEARQQKRDKQIHQRFAETLRKAKEREMKRQQAVLLREQEKERRRQHLLLLKTLETRKKQEDRDKLREEKINEKRIIQERRMLQRQQEIEMARQLQRPMEDMELTDHKLFPNIPRIPGMSLSGETYADCLMCVEFLHNFGDALGLDEDSLLNLDSLQNALLNRTEDDIQDFLSLVTHLLRFALEDPGLPNPREGVTKLGQKITDIDITPTLLSEVLRIFIRCRNGGDNELSESLQADALESLNPTRKARILAFLCDELVASRTITSEIERNIDSINTMRKDKWIIEGKLRKLRMTQIRKFHKQSKLNAAQEEESNTNMSAASKRSEDDIAKLDDLEDKEIDSGHESDSTVATNNTNNTSDEEDDITLEECDKKIEKLTKQHSNYRNKVNNASIKLRTTPYGEDRYRRNYWALPYCGGLYIEGLESGDPDVYHDNISKYGESKETEAIKKKPDEDSKQTDIKQEVKDDPEAEITKVKTEQDDLDLENKSSSAESKLESEVSDKNSENEQMSVQENQNVQKECNSLSNGVESNSADKMDTDTSIPKTVDVSKTSDDSKLVNCDNHESTPVQNTTAHVQSTPTSPSLSLPSSSSLLIASENTSSTMETKSSDSVTTKSERKPSFMSIDALLKKEKNLDSEFNEEKSEDVKTESNNNNNNNHFLPTSIFPPSPLITDHYFRSYTDILENRPWFSILPRMPCDDSSLTRSSQSQPHTPSGNNSMSYLSLLPISPFNVSSPLLSSQLQSPSANTSLDVSNISALCESSDVMNFKVPNNPSDGPSSSSCGNDVKPPVKSEAKPIPLDKQTGWWRVATGEQLQEIVKCLHCRGIREKELVKVLQRYVDCPNYIVNTGKKNVCKVDPNKESLTEEQKQLESELMKNEEMIFKDVEHELDLAALENMETLESRIYQASLQVKGWKSLTKATDDPNLELISRNKTPENKNQRHPLDIGKERLLLLESNIERRYLKPPLSRSVALNMANMSNNDSRSHDQDDDEIEHVTAPGLLTWRNVVAKVESPAQLVLCVNQLSTSIAWEKSIMKVICEICRKDDNEAELLLCDGCDKGYHTYCFKPRMDTVPDGDWYCYECISKASGASHCIRCGKRTGKIVECDDCPRAFHVDCLDPPLHRLPKKWQCAACAEKKAKKGGKRGPRKKSITNTAGTEKPESESKGDSPTPTPPTPPVEKKKKEPPSVTRDADLILCKKLLADMEKHDEGWPFLQPVNGKQFPSYRKIIKHPMDFNTMKNKLRDNLYKSRIEFAGDTHLVFDNCVTFNEDDSEVGQAGHNMRDFFQKRYSELFPDDS